MNILITGSNGFIGKNLSSQIKQFNNYKISTFTRLDSKNSLDNKIKDSDLIIHLAGENRPKDPIDFNTSNVLLTQDICSAIDKADKKIPILFLSSEHAETYSLKPKDSNNYIYGKSKREAEIYLENFSSISGNSVIIYRAPGVFGKWCKPNYNSVVSTFCHNIANDLPVSVDNPNTTLSLVHVDDLIAQILLDIKNFKTGFSYTEVNNIYTITLKELEDILSSFRESRYTLILNDIGSGIKKLLYTTYVSYLSPENFCYEVPIHADERGVFVEILKTSNSGQFSYFTSLPGVSRGEHYHNIKTEKFMILSGKAKFAFRNIITNEKYEIILSEGGSKIIETSPGWAHNITNIGNEKLIAVVWANEIFDKDKPDTIFEKV